MSNMAFTSAADWIIPLHQLWPPANDPQATEWDIVFFHGLQFAHGDANVWRSTWLQRGSDECWPEKWLPRDLKDHKVRILLAEYDADVTQHRGRGNAEDVSVFGHNLLQSLVTSGDIGQSPVFLVGHSYGGLVIKSLVAEAWAATHRRVRNSLDEHSVPRCREFLQNLKGIAFYAVPHLGSEHLGEYARECKKRRIWPATQAAQVGFLNDLALFNKEMDKLTRDFEAATESAHNIYAFSEGVPTLGSDREGRIIVPHVSAVRCSGENHYRLSDCSHTEVCKPPNEEHPSYKLLLHFLRTCIAKIQTEKLARASKILELNERIKEKVSPSSMAHFSEQSSSMIKSHAGIMQPVPNKILGMEDYFRRVKSAVIEGHASGSSSCVAIQGMGGAGKTLLAQMVNNDKVIQDVFGKESILWITLGREAFVPNIYVRMGKHLLVDIDSKSSLDDQRTHLMNEFASRRVLLILDDVWDNVCIEYREMVEWLNIATGPGSVTVLTTREASIARRIDARMEVILLLSEDQSWELFCAHAFGTDTPKVCQELEALAKDVCKECKCLPLALKVVGCAMRGKVHAIAEWRSTLHRLQDSSLVNKSVEEQLFKRLQVSYDQLDAATKICFLYFGAFPEDYEISVEQLCQIWVAEALFGEGLNEKAALDEARCALNELRGRTLIDDCGFDGIEDDSCVKMHDILRDLAIHLTRDGKDHLRESLFKLETKYLEEFPASWLRLPLMVKRMSLWGKKIKRFPSNFRAPHLKVCLLHAQLDEYWTFGNDNQIFIEDNFFKDLEDLKYLQICSNYLLRKLAESIGGLGSLQHLNLSDCRALKELPQSIGGLGSLQYLNLSGCGALEELPQSIGGLGSLQHFNLSGCGALEELPESIGELGFLQHLNLSECDALEELPESIGGLGSLQHLNLSSCGALKELPESIGGLGSLQHLNLSGCGALEELPESIGELGFLQHLNLNQCDALEELPESIGGLESLQHLNLIWCCALKELPESIEGLESLQHLNLNYCNVLKELPKSIGGLGSLQHLNLEWCRALEELPESIDGLGSLQHLNLSGCALKELPESIGELGSLQHLNLSGCDALEELPESIGELGFLQHLNLNQCDALEELPESIGGLESLQHLNLIWCRALKELPESIVGLESLQHLNLSYCNVLKELPKSIGGLGSLQHLNLSYCNVLKELPKSIGGLGSLQHLNLSYCNVLKELPESIDGLGSLQHLDLSDCRALKKLPVSIGGLGSLQHLSLSYCNALKELPESIEGLGSLQHLNLSYCDALKELPKSIGGLGSLQHLNLGYCNALKELPKSVGGLESLQHLNFEWCCALKELPESIRGLGSLEYLNVSHCEALEEFLKFAQLPCLQNLN